jgi:hypothetical protein
VANPQIRGQAQGLLVLCTLGVGMWIGANVAGRVEAHYTPESSRNLNKQAQEAGAKVESLEKELVAEADSTRQASIENQIADLKQEQQNLSLEALKLMDWRSIWAIPAVGAAIVLAFFTVAFRDDSQQPASA